MNDLSILRLKKNEERRIRAGHLWIFSNEINTTVSPLKNFFPGQEVLVEAHDQSRIGVAYINPHSLIAARLFSRDINARLNQAFFIEKMQTALSLRSLLFPHPYYRFIFGESDQLPGLVVDRFGDTLVVQINTAGLEKQKECILSSLLDVLPTIKTVLWRNDSPARIQEGLPLSVSIAYGSIAEKISVEENGLQFYTPFLEGQKTGWFYDHRLNRTRLKDYVVNQRVLDVFSYLGAWGIQAAKWGASEVLCVDSAELSTQYINENAERNGVGNIVHTLRSDAFDALKLLAQQKEQFDVIILDPPAFAKKLKDKKEGFLAYQRINELALKILRPGGILISCSCSMHLAFDDLLHLLSRASARTHSELQILERGHQAPDHPVHLAIPETDYLKMVIARKLKRE